MTSATGATSPADAAPRPASATQPKRNAASRGWNRPRSMRGKLLLWLVSLHLVAAAVVGWCAYAGYGRMVHTFMDDQMQLLADSYTGRQSAPVLQPVESDDVFKWGAFLVQAWSPDGRLLASSWPQSTVPLQATPGWHDVSTGPRDFDTWRVYTAVPSEAPDSPRIQIMQSGGFRHHQVTKRALLAGLPVAIILPVSLFILWGVVCSTSRSLGEVARDVVAQDERRIAEISPDRVPDEIAPLVVAFNDLLARLRDAFAAQRRFVQDAAHELRTPVTAIGLRVLRPTRGGSEPRPAPDRPAAAPVAPGDADRHRAIRKQRHRCVAADVHRAGNAIGRQPPHRPRLRAPDNRGRGCACRGVAQRLRQPDR